MEKTHVTTSRRDPQKMIEEIDMEIKGDDPEITATTAPIAKAPQDTKTTTIKEVIAEARDIEATKKMTIKRFPQENPESTTRRQKICSMDLVIYTQRSSMGSEYQDTQ
jgi:hypothetical protein